MPKYTLSDAARRAKIARSTLYTNYINTGKISVIKELVNGREKAFIDAAEFQRVFSNTLPDSSGLHLQDSLSDSSGQSEYSIIQVLQEQIRKAEEREQQSQIRETRLLNQIDNLTQALRQIEHKPTAAHTGIVPEEDASEPQGDQEGTATNREVTNLLLKQLIADPPKEQEEQHSWLVRLLLRKIW